MKQFFKWIGKHIAGALVFSLFSILFIAGIVYALTYPSAPPTGEVAGGKFMQYFNSIKVSCPDGYYLNGYDVNYNKICAVAPAGPQGPAGANGATGPAGASGGGAGCSIIGFYAPGSYFQPTWGNVIVPEMTVMLGPKTQCPGLTIDQCINGAWINTQFIVGSCGG